MTPAPLVWLADGRAVSDETLASFIDWLSPGEVMRYAGFTRRLRQRQFLIGRILLRQALGTLLGTSGADLSLIEMPGAGPRLDWPDSAGVGFSISHSGAWVACAASASSMLGLDIEVIDPARDLPALAGQAFDPDENAWLRSRPDGSRTRDFYGVWSAKEARFKLHSEQGECIHLFHDELSIALCSEQPLAQAPLLSLRSLDVAPHPQAPQYFIP